jgi:hypothetical protein
MSVIVAHIARGIEMTSEERMKRVKRDDFFTGGSDDGLLMTEGWLGNLNWNDLELAPPKDWRPFCFHLYQFDDCYTMADENDYCRNCPYRKRD